MKNEPPRSPSDVMKNFTLDPAKLTDTDRNQVITEAANRGYHMFIEDLGSNGQARRMLGV